MYLLVPYDAVKDIFPCARVVNGKAILPLAQIRLLKGVQGIEVVGSHDVDLMIASLRENVQDEGEPVSTSEEILDEENDDNEVSQPEEEEDNE